jgi:transcriptional regulator with GAF, ATPase, and Fis domain
MTESRELKWLRRLREITQRIAAETDLEQLFTLIIESAIELTDAERGFVVRLRGSGTARTLKVEVALGFDGEALRGAEGKLSKTVVDRVLKHDRAVVTSREEDTDILEVSSVQARRVRSIVCVPMRIRDETCGILYLDHRFDQRAFSEDDLPCLEAFAEQAVLALESADLAREVNEQSETLNASLRQLDQMKGASVPGDALPDPKSLPRFGGLVGSSVAAKDLYHQVERVARSYRPAVVAGASGSGKGRVAGEIHARSPRSHRPFLTQGCSGVDPRQLEIDLFGTVTIIGTVKPGLLETASPGTLYLEEVEALSLRVQEKLLRAVREGTVVPVNGGREREISCRLLVSFRQDPVQLVADKRFREDLHCLLDVQRVNVPSLSDRSEDIPVLLSEFLADQPGVSIEPGIMDRLVDYDWPGNVRELKNFAYRVASSGTGRIDLTTLPEPLRAPQSRVRPLVEVRRELIVTALAEARGNKTAAAKKLAIPRSTFYRLVERFGIS